MHVSKNCIVHVMNLQVESKTSVLAEKRSGALSHTTYPTQIIMIDMIFYHISTSWMMNHLTVEGVQLETWQGAFKIIIIMKTFIGKIGCSWNLINIFYWRDLMQLEFDKNNLLKELDVVRIRPLLWSSLFIRAGFYALGSMHFVMGMHYVCWVYYFA